jgi:hypothetical protein
MGDLTPKSAPGQMPSVTQALAQGAVGAVAGGFGQAAASFTGIGMVSETSLGVGSTVSTAAGAIINIFGTTDKGGMKEQKTIAENKPAKIEKPKPSDVNTK